MNRSNSLVDVVGGFRVNRQRFLMLPQPLPAWTISGLTITARGSIGKPIYRRPGVRGTFDQITAILSSRLYSEAGWKQRPEVLEQPIKTPIIITGIVRSGTTALHKLMSADEVEESLMILAQTFLNNTFPSMWNMTLEVAVIAQI